MQLGHSSNFIFLFIFIGLSRFKTVSSYCPQIVKASLGGQCLYKTKYALQKLCKLI